MVVLLNSGIKSILSESRDRLLAVYGASAHCNALFQQLKEYHLDEKITFIVDRDQSKDGSLFYSGGTSFQVISLQTFCKIEHAADKYSFIIPLENYKAAISQLDEVAELDGMPCYVWWIPFLSIHGGKDYGRRWSCPPATGKSDIPKVIHYFWFGNREMPELERNCIASWKKYCPDFQIVRWDEQNYNVEKIPYTADAYRHGKYGFVADYARYDVIEQYGGFYFDTDVELVRSISELCVYRAFFSFEFYCLINSGSGFGARSHDPVIRDLKEAYHGRRFCKGAGVYNTKPCSEYETEYFASKGVPIDNSFHNIDGILFLPNEVFAPVNQDTAMLEMTENTRGIHRFSCSWLDEESLREWSGRKANVSAFNQRLIRDWKRYHGVDGL